MMLIMCWRVTSMNMQTRLMMMIMMVTMTTGQFRLKHLRNSGRTHGSTESGPSIFVYHNPFNFELSSAAHGLRGKPATRVITATRLIRPRGITRPCGLTRPCGFKRPCSLKRSRGLKRPRELRRPCGLKQSCALQRLCG